MKQLNTEKIQGRQRIEESRKIEFTDDIMEDLKRRDFTINAIAFDGENYRCAEHAVEDIVNRNLRFVGEASERIKEDPLRVMRLQISVTKDLNNKMNIEQLQHIFPCKKPTLWKE